MIFHKLAKYMYNTSTALPRASLKSDDKGEWFPTPCMDIATVECLKCSRAFKVRNLGTSGVLFSHAIIIFHEFYFHNSKEPRETRVIKLS